MSNEAQAMKTRKPGRPKAGSEDKKARILAEALILFSTRGFVATSLADIARAADISKAGLLHHFRALRRERRPRLMRGWIWLRITNVIPMVSPCTQRCRLP